MYELGIGTPQDTDAALTWYGKAVEHGHELATDNLERLLRKQMKKSVKVLYKASSKNLYQF